MKRFIGANLPPALLVLAVWSLLAFFYPPLLVPGVFATAARLWAIFSRPENLAVLGLTLLRLLAGLGIGIAGGILLGAAAGRFPRLRKLLSPLIGLAQAVPPVSWLILALIWFGFNGRPSVFIVAVASLPAVAVGVMEGCGAVDPKLLAMGRVYRFSRGKLCRLIVIPSILPHFRAGVRVAIGIGTKAVVMGEVLTTSTGVGGAIADARLNLEPESVAAWTLALLAAYWLLAGLAGLLLRGPATGRAR
ncbi:MAG: ABC transporter permease subunit [Planctomycetota bacterium]|jgi:NitT/TauT family transport system permease protein|nr:ABC transporter permease subunit [Planctomycetota bacterium]